MPRPILLVAESPADRTRLRAALGDLFPDHPVLGAEDALAALAAAELTPPALILALTAPEPLGGVDLCRQVKALPRLRSTVVVLVAPTGEEAELAAARAAGADRILSGWPDAGALAGWVGERLGGSAAEPSGLALVERLMALRFPDQVARSARVADLVDRLAISLGLPPAVRREAGLAARVRDIGRLAMADGESADSLTLTLVGHRILVGLPGWGEVPDLLRALGEHHDGTGRPDHLTGSAIPVGARVVTAVGLALDGPPGEPGGADRVRAARGTRLDPAVADHLAALLTNESAEAGGEVRAVALADLAPGMRLAAEVRTAGGLLLLPAGARLTEAAIRRINAIHGGDPLLGRLLVRPPDPG